MGRLDRVIASLKESNRHMARVTIILNGVIDNLRSQTEEVHRNNLTLTTENSALKEQKAIADKNRFGSKS